ncbi:hypothetical protein [Clostridium sp.]|uniref:hypothetical protein n=1 Tax=Clostridium sp. TaxID=1506 RepID=UPI0032171134
MKGLDIAIKDLNLTAGQTIYLGRLLNDVRGEQGDIELIHSLEKNLIHDGKLLPKKDDLKLW